MLNPTQIPDDSPIHGPLLHADGSATFSLWTPAHERAAILPLLMCLTGGEACYLIRGPQAVTVQWLCVEGALLRLNANLSNSVGGGFPVAEGREVCMEGHRDERGVLQPWSVQWSLIRD
jgi:Domain of unknown function (DUF3459)